MNTPIAIPELSKLTALKSQLDAIAAEAKQIKVTDELTLAIGQQNLSKIAALVKTVEEKRVEIKKPYKEAGELIDATAKNLTNNCNQAVAHLKSEIKAWEIARIEAEKIQEENNVVAPPVAAAKGTRKVWKFELVDITKVPAEWLQLNEAAVREFLNQNKDSLSDGEIKDGVKFYKDITITS